jgi:hypothetical protein
LTLQSLLF